MNEVKEVCALMLDEPEPPLRAGSDVWSQARRATRRRAAHRLIGAGGAGLAAAAAVALVAGSLAGPGAVNDRSTAGGASVDGPGPARRAPDMVAAAQRTLPDAPTAEQITAHADQIFHALFGAVPSGYEAHRRWGDDSFPLWYYSGHGPGALDTGNFVAMASVLLRAEGREGALSASVRSDHLPAPTGDLCSAAVDERTGQVPGRTCQVITVGGLPMRVTTHHDPEEQEVVTATWFVRNGFVSVSAAQGLPEYTQDTHRPADAPDPGGDAPQHLPPLAHPVFTPQQVAAIAADPGLLP